MTFEHHFNTIRFCRFYLKKSFQKLCISHKIIIFTTNKEGIKCLNLLSCQAVL